jgi:hypothetical protein
MVRYERTENGRALNAVLIVAVVVMLASFSPVLLEVIAGQSHPGILVVVLMPLFLMGIILPGITKLSICLSDESLDVRMGIFSRKINLGDVITASIVSIPWYAGWGVRFAFSGGELWRVTGTHAVKLELRNRSSYLLGMNDPESLEAAIRSVLRLTRRQASCPGQATA